MDSFLHFIVVRSAMNVKKKVSRKSEKGISQATSEGSLCARVRQQIVSLAHRRMTSGIDQYSKCDTIVVVMPYIHLIDILWIKELLCTKMSSPR